jgi:hypothetical protein
MTPTLFPELDADRAQGEADRILEAIDLAARLAEWNASEDTRRADWEAARQNPDEGLDRGPDRGWQRRLPNAGFVRLVENPTPCFELPRQAVTWIVCELCGCDTDEWRLRPSSWRAGTTLRVCPRCARRR